MNGLLSRTLLALFFVAGGTLHFVFTAAYAGIMPPWLPWQRALVLISGVFEITGGLGVFFRATRRAAGVGLILLSIAVWPANLQMFLIARAAGDPVWWQALLFLRLPLQLLLILWIWQATRCRSAATVGERQLKR